MAQTIAPVPVPFPQPSLKAQPIISEQLRPWSANKKVTFDPAKHLSYTTEPEIHTMQDLGLPHDLGISPLGSSEPFPLFSDEAIQNMRDEIFTNEVWEDCFYTSKFAGCQLRGHCPKYAPFMHEAWTHPRTLEIMSKIAGVDLVPVMDIEIGNINISVKSKSAAAAELDAWEKSRGDDAVTLWHRDSYPVVCVVMLSDASTMKGGETAIETGNGDIVKVRGPQRGCAVMLQGRYINHQALAAIGGTERISMITAFRPRDVFLPDNSDLERIRMITEHSELFYQWAKYRVEIVQERLQGMLRLLEDQHEKGAKTDAARIKKFLEEQEEFLRVTSNEIVPEA